jgi:hypothetical protein
MPNWTFLLIAVFVTLGLQTRKTWNVHIAAVGITIVVLLFVAVSEHLLA